MKHLFTSLIITLFVSTSMVADESTPVVVGGIAPDGDANAWVHEMGQMRFVRTDSDYYTNKLLPVAPALNYGGIFPTCVAMVLMYHNEDLRLFPSHIKDFMSPEAMALIASPEYFADYYFPDDSTTIYAIDDKSGPLGDRSYNWIHRQDNCIADRCFTSQSFLGARAGMTIVGWIGASSYSLNANYNGRIIQIRVGLINSVSDSLYQLGLWIDENRWGDPHGQQLRSELEYLTYKDDFWSNNDDNPNDYYWSHITEEIDAGRPMVAVIKDPQYGENERIVTSCVTIVGYAQDPTNRVFAAYNGGSYEVQWYYLNDRIAGIIPFDPFRETDATLVTDAVHRFYNPNTGAYFFTAFASEAQAVLDNLSIWQYQGPVFRVEYGPDANNVPVYRFLNTIAGAHFYTASEAEKDAVIANLSESYHYEGIAFYVRSYAQPYNPAAPDQPTYYPIWRCYLPHTASHYFTASRTEVEYIRQHVDPSLIRVEGIAWYSDYIYDIQ